jgi:hypothetical protein
MPHVTGEERVCCLLPSKRAAFLSFFWFAFCAVAFSNAAGVKNSLAALFAIIVAGNGCMIGFVRRALRLWHQRRVPGAMRTVQCLLVEWIGELLLLGLPLLLAFFGVFASVRFEISKPALAAYAESVRAGKIEIGYEFNHPPRNAGLFTITRTDLLADGTVRMLTGSYGLLDYAGFAYSPGHTPPRVGEDSYRMIDADWWRWHESW